MSRMFFLKLKRCFMQLCIVCMLKTSVSFYVHMLFPIMLYANISMACVGTWNFFQGVFGLRK